MEAYLGAAPTLKTGAQAREQAFKEVSRPRVVELSTHGYFVEAPPKVPPDRDSLLSEEPALALQMVTALNPLLRCGLVLAGANHPGGSDNDDGLLTGLEILDTDLRGTELVVLSACDTGLGETRTGEGVIGLRQAFQLAGRRPWWRPCGPFPTGRPAT